MIARMSEEWPWPDGPIGSAGPWVEALMPYARARDVAGGRAFVDANPGIWRALFAELQQAAAAAPRPGGRPRGAPRNPEFLGRLGEPGGIRYLPQWWSKDAGELDAAEQEGACSQAGADSACWASVNLGRLGGLMMIFEYGPLLQAHLDATIGCRGCEGGEVDGGVLSSCRLLSSRISLELVHFESGDEDYWNTWIYRAVCCCLEDDDVDIDVPETTTTDPPIVRLP